MRRLIVQIPQPCHERWSEMEPTDQGRFCARCQKTVVDYTTLTDQQLINALSQPLATSCGRFRNEQLNRPLLQAKPNASSFWPRWVSLLTAGLFGWQTARAQVEKPGDVTRTALVKPAASRPTFSVETITARPTPAVCEVKGTVMQEESNGHLSVVPQAYVYISGPAGTWSTRTDSSGAFTVVISTKNIQTELRVQGWTPDHRLLSQTTIQVSPNDTSILVGDLMAHSTRPMQNITGGGIALVQTPSRWQKLKRRLFH